MQKLNDDKNSEEKIKNLESQNLILGRMNKYKFTGNFSFRGNNKFGAKILAGTAYDLITNADLLNEVLTEFKLNKEKSEKM